MPFSQSIFNQSTQYHPEFLRRVPGKNHCLVCGENLNIPGNNWGIVTDSVRGKNKIIGYAHLDCSFEDDDLEEI